mgnify:CR=1 FL=1
MFDSYVQVWDGNKECLGNAEWFYLCSAIQGMWNEVVLEDVKEADGGRGERDEVRKVHPSYRILCATF